MTIPSDEFGSQSVTLLAVRPHPDDESTSTGGMLAYYCARDVRTGVVICTGGEEGENASILSRPSWVVPAWLLLTAKYSPQTPG